MSPNQKLQCSLCLASFRRVEHLRRHLASHTDVRPFSCIFCTKSFKRNDVLKRHWDTCKSRIDNGKSIPDTSSIRKSKREVCDNCARLKRACNLESPCGTCFAKNQKCSYSGVFSSEGNAGNDDPNIDQRQVHTVPFSFAESASRTGLNSTILREAAPSSADRASDTVVFEKRSFQCSSISFASKQLKDGQTPAYSWEKLDFLNHTTAISRMKGILNCFECGSPSQRLEIANSTWYDPSIAQNEAFSLESWNPEAALAESHGNDQPIPEILFPGLTWDGVNMTASSPCAIEEQAGFPWRDFDLDPLADTTTEIVRRLGDVVCYHFKDHEWLPCTETRCTQFFKPSNIRKFIRLFWGVWYPNCCIIHKPTFCLLTTPLPLLLSMAIIGASVSVDEEDAQGARLWFDAVEELVFGDDCFQEALTGSPGNQSHSGYELLRALQASYFVCVYQNWEGSNKSRERIRRLRYSMVVTVARSLELSSATHGKLDLVNFDWHEFVRDEELIRTLLYVFLIDTAFTIFNNLPPRLAFSELKLSLACPEPCFQAQSADDCLLELHMASSAVPPINTVASAIETLCETEICPDDWQALSRTGVLNLFIIISALHVLIFNAKTLLALKPSLLPIQQGLKNWKRLWDKQHTSKTYTWPDEPSVTEMWKRDGFMKNAGEYWALAAMKLERMKPPRSSRVATIPSKPGNAEKYDDTDLEQVIDLIQDFRKIAL